MSGPHRVIQPEGWPPPRGYANGVAARGTMVFVAGQIGWDAGGALAAGFVAQAEQALKNVASVLAAAGAEPAHLTRMTWYVTDMDAYRGSLRALGGAYRRVIGASYPAMALVQVVSLVEPGALIEIEATAVIPD